MNNLERMKSMMKQNTETEGIDFIQVHIKGRNHLFPGHFMEDKKGKDAYILFLLFMVRFFMPHSNQKEEGLAFIERIQHSIGDDGDFEEKYKEALALKEEDIVDLIVSVQKDGAVPAFALDAMLLYEKMNPQGDEALTQLAQVFRYMEVNEKLLDEIADAVEIIRNKDLKKIAEESGQWKELDLAIVMPYFDSNADKVLLDMAEKYRDAGDSVTAGKWYKQAFNRHGDYAGDAAKELGWIYYNAKNYESAVEWFQKGAEAGSGWAMNTLAMLYSSGKVIEKDIEKAKEWYKRAYDLHKNIVSGISANDLGNIFAGEGKYKLAAEWYQKGAEAGSDWAMYNLAGLYLKGEGVDEDINKAKELLQEVIDLDAYNGAKDEAQKALDFISENKVTIPSMDGKRVLIRHRHL